MARIEQDIPLIAGVDEAGRGPLAGPVVAGAVILGDRSLADLVDSKKLTAAKREQVFERIFATAVAVGIGLASVEEIDRMNIHHATLLAMQRAVTALDVAPGECLVDGKFCPELAMPARAIVGGDASEIEISAASIVAKVTRDRLMEKMHASHPEYGFDRHKGYPTAAHLLALKTHGVLPEHRRTFGPVAKLLAGRTVT